MTTNQSQQIVKARRSIMENKSHYFVTAILAGVLLTVMLERGRAEIASELEGTLKARASGLSDDTGDAGDSQGAKPVTVSERTMRGAALEDGGLALRQPSDPDSDRAEIVGGWEGTIGGATYTLTCLPDGTGSMGDSRQMDPITWKQVGNEYEITGPTNKDKKILGTVREDGSLALRQPDAPDRGLLILKRVKEK